MKLRRIVLIALLQNRFSCSKRTGDTIRPSTGNRKERINKAHPGNQRFIGFKFLGV